MLNCTEGSAVGPPLPHHDISFSMFHPWFWNKLQRLQNVEFNLLILVPWSYTHRYVWLVLTDGLVEKFLPSPSYSAIHSITAQVSRHPQICLAGPHESLPTLTSYIHRRQCTWIIDCYLLPSETFFGNFCVLRRSCATPQPMSANEYTFVWI
jgi:hypothetical protein